jgi:hypothetical protein
VNVQKCYCCGRFISLKDLDSGKCESEDVWATGPSPELLEVLFFCVSCTGKEKMRKEVGSEHN